jgi:molybdopterin/thiamine biosynthesis adenylyltransferase
VNVTPHHCRIQEKPDDWYQQFTVIILGLDSLEARQYMNSVVCSFLGGSWGFMMEQWKILPEFFLCRVGGDCRSSGLNFQVSYLDGTSKGLNGSPTALMRVS